MLEDLGMQHKGREERGLDLQVRHKLTSRVEVLEGRETVRHVDFLALARIG